ncbi:MAG: methyltransferase domain-containing protein [Erysipelotrichia bacterium]|nr:methyltransferase domain-containing protein [Erysipelotrichia bacterium]NCC54103.1 methyltransferase domain-containing protein [Erysipelotrichia bacterium]
MLICPVCKQELQKEEKRYVCKKNHSFDMAKQGYTNLYLKSSKNSGDNKEMIAARTSFLNMHHYDRLVDAIIEIVKEKQGNTVIDAGCGEGYYTNLISQATNSEIYAFDLSKEALKYAAKQNKQIHYYLSSIFDIPMSDESCDLLLNIFAPLANEEYYRLVKSGGYLIKVDPHHTHLKEMKDLLYDEVYENEVLALKVKGFRLEKYQELTYTMHLKKEAIQALFKMTPYYYKSSKKKSEYLMNVEKMECTASFMIYIYKKE